MNVPNKHNDKHIFLRLHCVYGYIPAEVVVFTFQNVSDPSAGPKVCFTRSIFSNDDQDT